MKIGLINMPFADILRPSIALSQLKTVIADAYPEVVVQELFFNFAMADMLSPEIYEFISSSGPSNTTGFGDWFFQQQAFPETEDNTSAYFDRYGTQLGEEAIQIYETVIRAKRAQLGDFLEGLINTYELDTYNIVGFTSMFMQNLASIALARRIKLRNPSVVILVGGANCESPMGEALVKNIPCIDFTFSGSALRSLLVFLGAFIAGEHDKLHSINGVFSKKNCQPPVPGDNIIFKPIAPVGEERPINEVVEVDYDEFLDTYNQYFPGNWKDPYLLFETSRGCWWGAKAHCTFCGLNGGNMGYRAIEPVKALPYMNDMFEKYGDRVTHYACVDNIIPKEYFTDVFPTWKIPKEASVFYEVKADLSEEQMDILARAQVTQIQPGIESLDTNTLKLMRKGTTAFGNVRLLKYCLQYKIAPVWNLLIGFPGELEETYRRYAAILPNLYHLPPPSGVFPVRFDRYSPYFTKAAEYQLDLEPLDYYNFIYAFDPAVIFDLAYYFADQNYDAAYITNAAKWVSTLRTVVENWNERWKENVVPPVLELVSEAGVNYIRDTRAATMQTFVLEELALQVLQSLSTHKNRQALFHGLLQYETDTIEKTLDFLFEKGCVFEEKGSMLSLVMNVTPAAKTIVTEAVKDHAMA